MSVYCKNKKKHVSAFYEQESGLFTYVSRMFMVIYCNL